MKLVIVESPAKCNTIKRYLGNEYEVMASLGHIRDLSTRGKGGLGVDIEHDFEPSYIINKDKFNVVKELLAAKQKADEVILATDPDREGEAIAWHLASILGLDIKKTKRLEFHEITRDSINAAIKTPRIINMDLVSSQETRRILDRIIGFSLSSLIYKKIKSRSAGRVQSATLKLIYDHDAEIEAFVPEEYWNLICKINLFGKEINLNYLGLHSQNSKITNEKDAKEVFESLGDKLVVINTEESIRTTESKEPFTTSTLQQEAFSKLKFKTKKTQSIAQELYEGIEVEGEHVGLITYMRTDSPRLSPTFTSRGEAYIAERFGKEFIGTAKNSKHNLSQDAHEAIRPTSNHRTPESVKNYLNHDQYVLYKLIYDRALASMMKPKKTKVITITFASETGHTFKYEIGQVIFPGYSIIYKDNEDELNEVHTLPQIGIGDVFNISDKKIEQKFTQAPAHYSEAKLVKMMEEVGIGRPSTYASTIETIRVRKYVTDQAGTLVITDQGKKTIEFLDSFFPDISDAKYTAEMEKTLDCVENGSESRVEVLNNFYGPFIDECDVAKHKIINDASGTPTGELCPKCGHPLIIKEGKTGEFVGCSNYPTCKYVKKEVKVLVEVGRNCPECGKPLVERTDKKGKKFIACSGFPKCKYTETNVEETYKEEDYVKKCPDCDGYLVKKKGKFGFFLGCTNYPTCNHMEKILRKKGKRN